MTLLCSIRLMPQPASAPAGAAHHRSCSLAAAPASASNADVQVGTVPNTIRVIDLVWLAPLTVYEKDPELPSANVKVAVPTVLRATCAGSNGAALNAGPRVAIRVPEYALAPVGVAVIESHQALPLA